MRVRKSKWISKHYIVSLEQLVIKKRRTKEGRKLTLAEFLWSMIGNWLKIKFKVNATTRFVPDRDANLFLFNLAAHYLCLVAFTIVKTVRINLKLRFQHFNRLLSRSRCC